MISSTRNRALSYSTMGKLPKGPFLTLGVTSAVTLGAIVYSHYSQIQEKATMRAGVERDKERIRIKRAMKKKEQQDQHEEEKKINH